MLRKLAIASSIVVGLFTLATLIAGLLGGGPDDATAPPLDPSQLPERFDPNRTTAVGEVPPLGAGAGGWVRREDPETGRVLQEFRYDQMDPREAGEFDVVQPEARLHLAPYRVIQMEAARGVITAPDNVPQQGRFSGGCIVRLYETRPGLPLTIGEDSPDLVATVQLEDATFDTRLGKIDSTGRVAVQSTNARFVGMGLTLVYNEPRQRVDYLQITEGEYLRYSPAARDDRPGDPAGPPGPPVDPNAPALDATAEDADPDAVQFYKVVFEREVHVRSAGRSIDAERLVGYFAYERGGSIEPGTTRRPPAPLPRGVPAGALASAGGDASVLAAAAAATPVTRAEAGDEAHDVIMTWEGKMVVTPENVRPPRIVGRRDVLLTFRGSPVELHSENNDLITCDRAEYHESANQVALRGSDEWPLHIDSPALGVLRADDMTLALDTGRGALWGAGWLRAHPSGRGAEGALPEGFAVRWSDRVDLEVTEPGQTPQGLERVRFVGDVAVDDPRFNLRGKQLGVRFEADEAGAHRRFSAIDGSGAVVINSPDGTIQADRFVLHTDEGRDGRIAPTALHAEKRVLVQDAASRESIACQRLRVQFAERSQIDRETGRPKIDVAMLLAGGDVDLRTADGARIRAQQLEADNEAGTATLAGQPVVIEQDDVTMELARLDIAESGARAKARGAGRFLLDRPNADEPDTPASQLDVRWTDSMTYDRRADVVEVFGGVVADQSDRPDQLNRLTAGSLRIDLLDAADANEPARAERALGGAKGGTTALQSLVARGDAVLLAQRWTSPARRKVHHRMRLGGSRISYDHTTERVEVPGKGTLLLEDYSEAGRGAPVKAVPISGRGATLFTWTGALTMDAAHADVLFVREVRMTHRPLDSDDVVELQAHRLEADIDSLGGLSAMQMSRARSLEVDHIEASGQVQLRDGRRVISANRIHYDGPTRRAVLTALPDRHVQVIQLDQPKPIRAKRITWDLANDRLELDEPGY